MSNFNNNFGVFIEKEKTWKMCTFFGNGVWQNPKTKPKTRNPKLFWFVAKKFPFFDCQKPDIFQFLLFQWKPPNFCRKEPIKISFCCRWCSSRRNRKKKFWLCPCAPWMVPAWAWDCDGLFVSTWAPASSLSGFTPSALAACPSRAVPGQVWASPVKYFGPLASWVVGSILRMVNTLWE